MTQESSRLIDFVFSVVTTTITKPNLYLQFGNKTKI